MDHLGSSAKLCVNPLRSGRLRLCNTIMALEGPTLGIRVMPGGLEWWGGQPFQVVLTAVLVSGMVLSSITVVRLSFAH